MRHTLYQCCNIYRISENTVPQRDVFDQKCTDRCFPFRTNRTSILCLFHLRNGSTRHSRLLFLTISVALLLPLLPKTLDPLFPRLPRNFSREPSSDVDLSCRFSMKTTKSPSFSLLHRAIFSYTTSISTLRRIRLLFSHYLHFPLRCPSILSLVL